MIAANVVAASVIAASAVAASVVAASVVAESVEPEQGKVLVAPEILNGVNDPEVRDVNEPNEHSRSLPVSRTCRGSFSAAAAAVDR